MKPDHCQLDPNEDQNGILPSESVASSPSMRRGSCAGRSVGFVWITSIVAAFAVAAAQADIVVPGADGSDDMLQPTDDLTIDLDLAATASWDTPSPVPGQGVYDVEQWAVVFKYESVHIPAGVTVTFKNHRANPPVVWLVSGDVWIEGTVRVDGGSVRPVPGPGGFRGADYMLAFAGDGLGPGGGNRSAVHANYGTDPQVDEDLRPRYGNNRILPLIGGSGGDDAGGRQGQGGAGAILVASARDLKIDGTISANSRFGGNYYGTGGAIRLIGETVSGTGSVEALGGNGGHGRIRIEAVTLESGIVTQPAATLGQPENPVLLWPPETYPSVRIVSVNSLMSPPDPLGALDVPGADLTIQSENEAEVVIATENVASDWTVLLRVVPRFLPSFEIPAEHVSGDTAGSMWRATVVLPTAYSALQVHATAPN